VRATRSVTIGFVKKEPALTESGSAASSTMPFDARRPSTLSRTREIGTRSPRFTCSASASWA
jgi:hypothetical protein